MNHLLLVLITFALSFSACAQPYYPDADKEAQRGEPIRDRKTQFTPYELYPWSLKSAPRLLDIYREKYDQSKQDPKENDAEELLNSKLRMDIRSLISDRNKFISYAMQDKSLSTEQREIIQGIQKASFPILQKKDIDELSSEELIKSISDEAVLISPMVKEFLDKREVEKNRP